MATSGRYEFHNKGIDLLLDSLSDIDRQLAEAESDTTVVAFLLVTCGYAVFSDDVRKRLQKERPDIEKYAGIATHHLGNATRTPSSSAAGSCIWTMPAKSVVASFSFRSIWTDMTAS
nr:hypothetical protein [Salidesulfovibrio brasiliensis]